MVSAQHSVARLWNEALLHAIRNDFVRPTVHARNLFHMSIAMYDAWAAYDDVASTFLLGNKVGSYECDFVGVDKPGDLQAARAEAVSYAAYRLLRYRYQGSPRADETLPRFNIIFDSFEYDPSITSTDYTTGSPAALGNYIAQCVIEFGLQDGSNESNEYSNIFYKPVNPPLVAAVRGNRDILYPNRWQPLIVKEFIDQTEVVFTGEQPDFVGPEWGKVVPFALTEKDLAMYNRAGDEYWVYHDPGPPVYVDPLGQGPMDEVYRWIHALSLIWSSHLDPSDNVKIDISPGNVGNFEIDEFGILGNLPRTVDELSAFYDPLSLRGLGSGRSLNPHSGKPYESVIVPRGDHARVVVEYWSDGPREETSPGHWFVILNNVSDHPTFEKRLSGRGLILDPLEWDVKAYLVLSGALHDAAISSWSIKGWYDYIRPISAIRWMAENGQSSDPNLPGYSPHGLPLIEGFIEVIQEGDSLASVAGDPDFNVGKVKVFAWRGPDFIDDPDTDVAGVKWILALSWWTYQAANFVTPPNAGYVSSIAAFSRAAAEVMGLLTGDEYFPDGLGHFRAEAHEFLQLEDGPSVDVTLQWATYRDAADEASLASFYAGIQTPISDIPGKLIGQQVGIDAFRKAEQYFFGMQTVVQESKKSALPIEFGLSQNYPNPFNNGTTIKYSIQEPVQVELSLYDLSGQKVLTLIKGWRWSGTYEVDWDGRNEQGTPIASGVYFYSLRAGQITMQKKLLLLR